MTEMPQNETPGTTWSFILSTDPLKGSISHLQVTLKEDVGGWKKGSQVRGRERRSVLLQPIPLRMLACFWGVERGFKPVVWGMYPNYHNVLVFEVQKEKSNL